jgi:hypothetical protein
MSEEASMWGQQTGETAAMNGNTPQRPPRIRIDVTLETLYQEIRNSVLRQAWQLAGTQLRAAVALGIRPETVSRNLRRAERDRAIGSSGHQRRKRVARFPAMRRVGGPGRVHG